MITASTVDAASCRLIGAGDGSVLVYCSVCREALAHKAFRGTLASASEAWDAHLGEHHAPQPEPADDTEADTCAHGSPAVESGSNAGFTGATIYWTVYADGCTDTDDSADNLGAVR